MSPWHVLWRRSSTLGRHVGFMKEEMPFRFYNGKILCSFSSLVSVSKMGDESEIESKAVSENEAINACRRENTVSPQEQTLLTRGGIVGAPNAGKSTLLNALVGQKVSAASHKTNTTASCRLGAFTEGMTQVVVYDTPGIVDAGHYRNPNHKNRIESAWKTTSECDLIMCVVDAARQIARPDMRVIRMVTSLGDYRRNAGNISNNSSSKFLPRTIELPPSVLVLNKIDAIPKRDQHDLIELADDFMSLGMFERLFCVSALRGQGILEFKQYLLNAASPADWIVDRHSITDVSREDHAAEIVREKIFRSLYQELPYNLEIRLVSSRMFEDGSSRIEFDIMTPTNIVRRMVVGRNGSTIGTIGKSARLDLERIWKSRVHLILNVRNSK